MGEAPRILLADDTDVFLQSTADLLRRDGYVCVCAHDAPEVAQALAASRFDLLIADINMPGNTELELLRTLRALPEPLPVIIVTAYPSVGTAVEALRLSVIDYLVKPLDLADLRDRVGRAIEKGRAMRSAVDLRASLAQWLAKLGEFQEAIAIPGVTPPAGRDRGTGGEGGRGITAEGDRGNAADGARGPLPADGDARDGDAALSARERDIGAALLRGESVTKVARTLGLSVHTVRNHVKSIYRKLGVHSQLELVARLKSRVQAA
jgi:DNA-binding NarL/FixJ family response regulator